MHIHMIEEMEMACSRDYITEAYAATVEGMANEGLYDEMSALDEWFAENIAGARGLWAAYIVDMYEDGQAEIAGRMAA